jgi:hypothetical protein
MRDVKIIDFARLLGFETVSDTIPGHVDFQDATLGAKLGAKVGAIEPNSPARIDFGKLLGFAAVSDEIGDSVDFRADVIEAKLGAKVGLESWVACEDEA